MLHLFDSLPHAEATPPEDSHVTVACTLHRSPRTAPRQSSATGTVRGPARRKKIDPTTCERDYRPEELEFMQALDRYKRSSGRMFPTCSEILEVVRGLGYVRQDGSH